MHTHIAYRRGWNFGECSTFVQKAAGRQNEKDEKKTMKKPTEENCAQNPW